MVNESLWSSLMWAASHPLHGHLDNSFRAIKPSRQPPKIPTKSTIGLGGPDRRRRLPPTSADNRSDGHALPLHRDQHRAPTVGGHAYRARRLYKVVGESLEPPTPESSHESPAPSPDRVREVESAVIPSRDSRITRELMRDTVGNTYFQFGVAVFESCECQLIRPRGILTVSYTI